MKLEKKITLTIITIFLTFGFLFFITGFSIFQLISDIFTMDKVFSYSLFLLFFICIFMLIGYTINQKIRKPLTYIVRWIDQLSNGNFNMPETTKDDTIKKMKFGFFSELKLKLERLTTQLKRAEDERKELDEIRKKWTAGVTHDLKTPLSYVKGYAAILRSEYKWNEDEIKEFAGIIEEKALYMEQLIDDLSVIYEFDKMQIPLNLQSINLVEFIRNVLDDFKKYPMATDYPIYFHTHGIDDILLSVDPTLLKRALENFLMNAVNHNPIGTMITITLERLEKETMIEISDNGIGMDRKMLKRLFNQYYRGTSTDKTHLGSGLGMSIAKQFIEKQNGEVHVISEKNKGTKIIIKFPN